MLVRNVSQAPGFVEVSAVVPVVDRVDDPEAVYFAYRDAIAAATSNFEFVYVLDGSHDRLREALERLRASGEPITIVTMPRSYGEAAAIGIGCEHARGDRIALLPAYLQIDPASITAMIPMLDSTDFVAPCRDRKGDVFASRARGKAFEVVARVSGARSDDLGCHVRLFRRAVMNDVELRDEQHRFLPILAEHAGYRVTRVMAPQAEADRRFRHHGPRAYLGRLLDLFAVSFLLKFIQKPFRFFGAIGLAGIIVGIGINLWLVVEKVALGKGMGDRPALLLATLLIVLGLQIAAVGLIAEIIIFTRARARPTYRIDHIVERDPAGAS